jgi:hypothetical protein
VLVIVAGFNLVLFDRYFPLSEGWWETYGWLWDAGLRPYRDFELAYTPLFVIVNAGLLRIFGGSFLALRLFGVAVLTGATLVLQLLVERLTGPRTAAVATLVATFLMMSQPQFIAKDYHVYQLGLVGLALLLQVRLAGAEGMTPRARLGAMALVGALAGVTFMLKQNVGGLLVLALAATVPVVERERRAATLAALLAGAALPVVLMLPVVTPADWRALLLSNDAKGDLRTVLFRFWRPDNRAKLALAFGLCAAWLAARQGLRAAPQAFRDRLAAVGARPAFRRVGLALALLTVAAAAYPLRRFLFRWGIELGLAVLAAVAFGVARDAAGRRRPTDARSAAVILPVLALVYANTTTAAFDLTALQLPLAVAFGWLLAAVEAWASVEGWAVAALGLAVSVPQIAVLKARVPYSWWGHVQAPLAAATEQSAYPQLRGITMGPEQRAALDAVKREVDTYSRSARDTLFFDAPVFYWLHCKLPPFRTVVQWFDVVPRREMEADLRALEARPPRLVVALDPPPAAFAVHRELRNVDRLPQEGFFALLDAWVANGRFRLVRSIPLPGPVHQAGEVVTQEVVVQGAAAVGQPLGRWEGVTVARRVSAGTVEASSPAPLAVGDVVTVTGSWAAVRAVAGQLGVARDGPRDWNVVNVYVRADVTPGDGSRLGGVGVGPGGCGMR